MVIASHSFKQGNASWEIKSIKLKTVKCDLRCVMTKTWSSLLYQQFNFPKSTPQLHILIYHSFKSTYTFKVCRFDLHRCRLGMWSSPPGRQTDHSLYDPQNEEFAPNSFIFRLGTINNVGFELCKWDRSILKIQVAVGTAKKGGLKGASRATKQKWPSIKIRICKNASFRYV